MSETDGGQTEARSDVVRAYVRGTGALMFVQLVHKAVREIPGMVAKGMAPGIVLTSAFAVVLTVGILLLLVGRARWGLIAGFIAAGAIIVQPVIAHGIMKAQRTGVWWYPAFPLTQGVLIICFGVLAWKAMARERGAA